MFTGVSIEQVDAIATLSIEGRTDLNLLGLDVFRSLSERVGECGGDENLRAIVLRGAGDRAFSASVDLRQMKDLDPLAAETFIRTLHAAARSLLNAPLPVVARDTGPVSGRRAGTGAGLRHQGCVV